MTQKNSNPINHEIIEWLYNAYREHHPTTEYIIQSDFKNFHEICKDKNMRRSPHVSD